MRREMIARRKRQHRIQGFVSVFALILSIVIVFCVAGVSTNARSVHDCSEYKYFKSYELEYGDTLWSIATDYVDGHYYESVEEYIDEVCVINSISTDSRLLAGTNLILPYYSTEFKP